jgi:hypothetical protein
MGIRVVVGVRVRSLFEMDGDVGREKAWRVAAHERPVAADLSINHLGSPNFIMSEMLAIGFARIPRNLRFALSASPCFHNQNAPCDARSLRRPPSGPSKESTTGPRRLGGTAGPPSWSAISVGLLREEAQSGAVRVGAFRYVDMVTASLVELLAHSCSGGSLPGVHRCLRLHRTSRFADRNGERRWPPSDDGDDDDDDDELQMARTGATSLRHRVVANEGTCLSAGQDAEDPGEGSGAARFSPPSPLEYSQVVVDALSSGAGR